MSSPNSGDDRLPTNDGPTRRLPRSSITPARLAALLQEPLPEATTAIPGLRFDRPQATPPRPHLAISAHRIWTEILNSAIGDDADTSLIHDLANLHPQVTTTILRAVNAAQGGVVRPVQEVGLAIELLGLRRLRSLATEQQERAAPPVAAPVSVQS
jgi:HDOD domain